MRKSAVPTDEPRKQRKSAASQNRFLVIPLGMTNNLGLALLTLLQKPIAQGMRMRAIKYHTHSFGFWLPVMALRNGVKGVPELANLV